MIALTRIEHASDRTLRRVANYFRALADPIRLRILRALMAHQRNIGKLVELIGGSQANVSKRLRLLVEAGILARDQRGIFTFLRIAGPAIPPLCEAAYASIGRSLEKDDLVRAALSPVYADTDRVAVAR